MYFEDILVAIARYQCYWKSLSFEHHFSLWISFFIKFRYLKLRSYEEACLEKSRVFTVKYLLIIASAGACSFKAFFNYLTLNGSYDSMLGKLRPAKPFYPLCQAFNVNSVTQQFSDNFKIFCMAVSLQSFRLFADLFELAAINFRLKTIVISKKKVFTLNLTLIS